MHWNKLWAALENAGRDRAMDVSIHRLHINHSSDHTIRGSSQPNKVIWNTVIRQVPTRQPYSSQARLTEARLKHMRTQSTDSTRAEKKHKRRPNKMNSICATQYVHHQLKIHTENSVRNFSGSQNKNLRAKQDT